MTSSTMIKKIYIPLIVLNYILFISPSFSLAKQPSPENEINRQRNIAMELALQEAEFVFAQRQRPWEYKEEEKKEKEEIKKKTAPLHIEGYYKNLFTASRTTFTEERFFADTQRLRLDSRLDINDKLQARGVFDQEAIIGDFANTPDFQAIRNKDQKKLALIDGDKAYSDRDHIFAKYTLYRAYLKYDNNKLQAFLGKQLIDWGRCRFFSPMDLFNPISPLNIERDERIGVDALNMEFSLKEAYNLNLVYAPQRKFETSSIGSRLYHRMGNYDLFFMLGEFRKDEVAGFGFDGYLGNGGLRGEFTSTHADNGRDFFRGVIGAEYNFPSKINVLGEYFYNGGAQDNNIAEFISSYKYSSKVLTLKKNLFGLWIEYEVTPLIKLGNYLIYDFDEQSRFFNPEVRYNVWANFDLSLGVQLFRGKADSEFGTYKDLYYAQAKYFF